MANKAHPFNPDSPLDRIPGESLRANTALRDYLFMGPGRSIRKLFERYRDQTEIEARSENGPLRLAPAEPPSKPPTTRLATLLDWSRKFAWQERVTARQEIIDIAEELKWEGRRQKQREEEWNLREKYHELLLAVFAQMPNFIKTKRRTIKETGQEIITLGMDSVFIAKATDAFSKLGRLAAGMATEHQEHSGSVSLVQVSADDMAKAREKAKQFEEEILDMLDEEEHGE